jgi:hypothetical protein
MSPDSLNGTVSNPQTLNRYAYVGNDPANITDPSGASWWDEFIEFFGADPNDNDGQPPAPQTSSLGDLPDAPSATAQGLANVQAMEAAALEDAANQQVISVALVFNGNAASALAAAPVAASHTLSIVQAALSVAGFIPVIGDFANLANAGISLAEGHYGQAALFAFSAIPVAGVLGEIGQAAEVAGEIEQSAQAGSELLLDTNAVIGEGKLFVAAGDNVVKASVSDVEIGNLVEQGRIGLPRAAGEIPTVPNSPNINLRINVRGLLTPKASGNFADGIIGATSLERGATLVTHDVALGDAVSGLGGNVILLP